MYKVALLFFTVITSLVFTTLSGGEPESVKPDLPYTIKDFSKNGGKCLLDKNSDSCATVTIHYPLFSSSLGNYSAEDLNQFIQKELITYLTYNDTKVHGVKTYAEKFIEDYLQFTREDEGSSGNWELNKNIQVKFLNNKILTLEDDEDGYTGGAHGFSRITLVSLDLEKIKPLKLEDILQNGAKNKLLPLAEAEFRKLRDLSADDNLEDAGFDFPNNKFSLSDNFAVMKKGLLFYYNSYDIAAYVFGPTELFIPYEKLNGVVSMARIGL